MLLTLHLKCMVSVFIPIEEIESLAERALVVFCCALLVVFVVRYANYCLRWTDASARTYTELRHFLGTAV